MYLTQQRADEGSAGERRDGHRPHRATLDIRGKLCKYALLVRQKGREAKYLPEYECKYNVSNRNVMSKLSKYDCLI